MRAFGVISILLLMKATNGEGFQVKKANSYLSKPLSMAKTQILADYERELWVVGAGTLGELVLKQWSVITPSSYGCVVAETRTASRHELFNKIENVMPALRKDRKESDDKTARNVLICLPPSAQSGAYLDEVKRATKLWRGLDGGGSLVITSSIGVYGDVQNSAVTEDSPVDTESERSKL